MSEFGWLATSGDLIRELPKPDLRYVTLDRDIASLGLGYLLRRYESPIVGMKSDQKFAMIDGGTPLGHLVGVLYDSVKTGSDEVVVGFSDEDVDFLTKDVESQVGTGDPEIVGWAQVFLKAVRERWEGAVE